MIRKAQLKDLNQIEQSYREHFRHEREHGAFTVFQEGVYPTGKDAELAFYNQALYIYEVDGVVAGSIILDKAQPEEYRRVTGFCEASEDEVMVIHLLMVRPCMAGKGIASALLSYAADAAREQHCRVLRLDTGSQNIPAVSLYKKNGFEIKETAHMKVGGAIAHDGHLFLEKIL